MRKKLDAFENNPKPWDLAKQAQKRVHELEVDFIVRICVFVSLEGN